MTKYSAFAILACAVFALEAFNPIWLHGSLSSGNLNSNHGQHLHRPKFFSFHIRWGSPEESSEGVAQSLATGHLSRLVAL
jgi:hypothetical protein